MAPRQRNNYVRASKPSFFFRSAFSFFGRKKKVGALDQAELQAHTELSCVLQARMNYCWEAFLTNGRWGNAMGGRVEATIDEFDGSNIGGMRRRE